MAKNPLKGIVVANNITRKEYEYKKDDITLAFKLRTDVKSELKGFKELMVRAIQDIDADLAAIDAKK